MKKLLWIINPLAGRGAVAGKVVDCVSIFQRAGYAVTLYATQGVQDATRVLQECIGVYDRIVCAGGDGTLHEVVTGLMEIPAKSRPPLGYIPAGTTNDFALSLGIPKTPIEAAKIAAGTYLQALDIGRFNNRYFNYIAAFGLFTEVAYATSQQFKNIFGRAAYLMEGIRSLTNIRQHHIKVTYDETTVEGNFIYGMVTNTISVGGFRTLSSDGVILDDGLYEVLLIYPIENPIELQWLANDLLTNTTSSHRFIYCRTSHIRFEAAEAIPWTLDGEFGGKIANVEIHNCSRAVTFVTGASAPLQLPANHKTNM